jgi:hypothetical protein
LLNIDIPPLLALQICPSGCVPVDLVDEIGRQADMIGCGRRMAEITPGMYKMADDARMTRYPQALRFVENLTVAGETAMRQARSS